jgi:hypothetical protein
MRSERFRVTSWSGQTETTGEEVGLLLLKGKSKICPIIAEIDQIASSVADSGEAVLMRTFRHLFGS